MNRSVKIEKEERVVSEDEVYIRRELIGKGSFKTVYKAYNEEDGLEVAWNEVPIGKKDQAHRDKITHEVQLLSQLNHPNIIRIHAAWEDKNRGMVCFITELMTSGTLRDFITNQSTCTVRRKIMRNFCIQILNGLQYLHAKSIIHRDLKCDNIFLNGNKGEVKIGDFGLSITKVKTYVESVIGTPEFMAPELYEEKYTEKVDIYSFGMCVLEMATGEYPYSECENVGQVFRKVTMGVKPRALEKIKDLEIKDFVLACLLPAETRPSAAQLLEYPFVSPHSFFASPFPSMDAVSELGDVQLGPASPLSPHSQLQRSRSVLDRRAGPLTFEAANLEGAPTTAVLPASPAETPSPPPKATGPGGEVAGSSHAAAPAASSHSQPLTAAAARVPVEVVQAAVAVLQSVPSTDGESLTQSWSLGQPFSIPPPLEHIGPDVHTPEHFARPPSSPSPRSPGLTTLNTEASNQSFSQPLHNLSNLPRGTVEEPKESDRPQGQTAAHDEPPKPPVPLHPLADPPAAPPKLAQAPPPAPHSSGTAKPAPKPVAPPAATASQGPPTQPPAPATAKPPPTAAPAGAPAASAPAPTPLQPAPQPIPQVATQPAVPPASPPPTPASTAPAPGASPPPATPAPAAPGLAHTAAQPTQAASTARPPPAAPASPPPPVSSAAPAAAPGPTPAAPAPTPAATTGRASPQQPAAPPPAAKASPDSVPEPSPAAAKPAPQPDPSSPPTTQVKKAVPASQPVMSSPPAADGSTLTPSRSADSMEPGPAPAAPAAKPPGAPAPAVAKIASKPNPRSVEKGQWEAVRLLQEMQEAAEKKFQVAAEEAHMEEEKEEQERVQKRSELDQERAKKLLERWTNLRKQELNEQLEYEREKVELERRLEAIQQQRRQLLEANGNPAAFREAAQRCTSPASPHSGKPAARSPTTTTTTTTATSPSPGPTPAPAPGAPGVLTKTNGNSKSNPSLPPTPEGGTRTSPTPPPVAGGASKAAIRQCQSTPNLQSKLGAAHAGPPTQLVDSAKPKPPVAPTGAVSAPPPPTAASALSPTPPAPSHAGHPPASGSAAPLGLAVVTAPHAAAAMPQPPATPGAAAQPKPASAPPATPVGIPPTSPVMGAGALFDKDRDRLKREEEARKDEERKKQAMETMTRLEVDLRGNLDRLMDGNRKASLGGPATPGPAPSVSKPMGRPANEPKLPPS